MVNYVPRGASARAIAAAVAAYNAAHPNTTPGAPGANATDAQVASAIATWMSTHPAATDAQVAAAVATYIAANGVATNAQLATAVGTYLAANPSALGIKLVNLGNVTVGQTAAIAITAGIRSISVTVAGAVIGDALILTPTAASLPEGYAIHNAIVTAANTVRVTLSAPLLAIGASYSIICRFAALR